MEGLGEAKRQDKLNAKSEFLWRPGQKETEIVECLEIKSKMRGKKLRVFTFCHVVFFTKLSHQTKR